jgi:hypothetical protein
MVLSVLLYEENQDLNLLSFIIITIKLLKQKLQNYSKDLLSINV